MNTQTIQRPRFLDGNREISEKIDVFQPHAVLIRDKDLPIPGTRIAFGCGDNREILAKFIGADIKQPFTVIEKASGQPVGMTTYMNIDPRNQRVEIGSTWYRRAVQRTGINTECKLMLLRRAFETLDCIAVEFRTHFFNHQSRRAIERLGAKLDGVLRSHARATNGTLRDTCVYSIIASEWPTVKANLEFQLERNVG